MFPVTVRQRVTLAWRSVLWFRRINLSPLRVEKFWCWVRLAGRACLTLFLLSKFQFAYSAARSLLGRPARKIF